MAARPRSLRTRLTLTLSLIVALAGLVLVGVLYLVLDYTVVAAASSVSLQEVPLLSAEDLASCEADPAACPGEFVAGPEIPADEVGVVVLEAQMRVANETLRTVALWSLGIVLVFAVLAWLVVRWVLRRSLRRLEDATAAARRIDSDQRSARLRVPGPQDEVKDLGDTVDETLDHLTEALDAQHRFVANASHELRTPLAAARTALDVPLAQGRVPADLEPAVRSALAANDRSTALLDALLLLARSGDSARDELEARADHLDLAQTVREELVEVDTTGHELTTELEPAVLVGDPVLLTQVVANLLGNAVQHNRSGGAISVHTGTLDDRVLLDVANDGAVLDPEQVDRLREPFHRGDRSRLAGEGLGLGLSIVDSVVARHDGTLTLTARAAGGLTVRVELPRGPRT